MVLVFHLASWLALVANGESRQESGGPYFYKSIPWGTQAQFNPLSQIANEGYDIGQLRTGRDPTPTMPPRVSFEHLNATLSHPIQSIDRLGWGRFLGTEVVPTSVDFRKAQWVPNYQLHLFGAGLLNVQSEEWFAANGVEHPKLAAFATSMSAAYLNEVSELQGATTDYATDPLADLLVFDLAGIAIFQSTALRRFFSSTVQWMNWPLQPSLRAGDWSVRNAGQYYALKFPLPGVSRWKGFYHFGLGNIAGLTRDLGDGYAWSMGAGVHAEHVVQVSPTQSSVQLAPKLGVFFDRENSLLASVFYNGQSQERFTVSVYPWESWTVPLGGWVSMGNARGMAFGVTTLIGIGAIP